MEQVVIAVKREENDLQKRKEQKCCANCNDCESGYCWATGILVYPNNSCNLFKK